MNDPYLNTQVLLVFFFSHKSLPHPTEGEEDSKNLCGINCQG